MCANYSYIHNFIIAHKIWGIKCGVKRISISCLKKKRPLAEVGQVKREFTCGVPGRLFCRMSVSGLYPETRELRRARSPELLCDGLWTFQGLPCSPGRVHVRTTHSLQLQWGVPVPWRRQCRRTKVWNIRIWVSDAPCHRTSTFRESSRYIWHKVIFMSGLEAVSGHPETLLRVSVPNLGWVSDSSGELKEKTK